MFPLALLAITALAVITGLLAALVPAFITGRQNVVTSLAGRRGVTKSKKRWLALGRMHVDAFAAQPQHQYLLRFVDAPERPPMLPHYDLVVDRGPFDAEADRRLMKAHRIDLVLCKNAGGTGAEAKLIAARALTLPVLPEASAPRARSIRSMRATLRAFATLVISTPVLSK